MREVVLIWRVTPSGSIRKYAIVPITPTIAPVVSGRHLVTISELRRDTEFSAAGTGFAIGVEYFPHLIAKTAIVATTIKVINSAPAYPKV